MVWVPSVKILISLLASVLVTVKEVVGVAIVKTPELELFTVNVAAEDRVKFVVPLYSISFVLLLTVSVFSVQVPAWLPVISIADSPAPDLFLKVPFEISVNSASLVTVTSVLSNVQPPDKSALFAVKVGQSRNVMPLAAVNTSLNKTSAFIIFRPLKFHVAALVALACIAKSQTVPDEIAELVNVIVSPVSF